jgi:hypothetical protein
MKASPFDPESLPVIVVKNRPVWVVFKKKKQKVREIVNVWRVDDTWWQKPVTRMYYAIELENSGRITIFQDLNSGGWYRQNWSV